MSDDTEHGPDDYSNNYRLEKTAVPEHEVEQLKSVYSTDHTISARFRNK
jgi:hypothetical protein